MLLRLWAFLIFTSALLQFSLLSRIFTFICIIFKCRSTKFAVKKNDRGIAWNYVVRITCPLYAPVHLPIIYIPFHTYRPTSSPHKPSECCSYNSDLCVRVYGRKKSAEKNWSLATLAEHHYETNYLAPQYIQLWSCMYSSVAKKCKHVYIVGSKATMPSTMTTNSILL